MTTTSKKTRTAKKPSHGKPLRIRPKLIPPTSTYITFEDGKEYVLIPAADFKSWYEDFEDKAIREYMGEDSPKTKKNESLLKTRKQYIPESSIKITVGKTRYTAVPVADVQEWFENIEDFAVIRYVDENPQPTITLEELSCRSKPSARKIGK